MPLPQASDQLATRATRKKLLTNAIRLSAIAFAEIHGKKNAAKKFDVDPSMISRWIKDRGKLATNPSKKKAGSGRRAKYFEEERLLDDWLLGLLSPLNKSTGNLTVTSEMVFNKMISLILPSSDSNISAEKFKSAKARAKIGITSKWLKRYLARSPVIQNSQIVIVFTKETLGSSSVEHENANSSSLGSNEFIPSEPPSSVVNENADFYRKFSDFVNDT
ncbi:hypothetical protein HK096_001942, partial [Nowakowskiella sp. JEL0078]